MGFKISCKYTIVMLVDLVYTLRIKRIDFYENIIYRKL